MLISLLFQEPLIFIPLALALLIALTWHEFFHAAVAVWQGDNTAKFAGRLTLNPLAHLDLTGTLLLLFVGFGWGKPVPVNYYNLRNQKWGPALVSIAGPFANLLSVVVFALIFKLIAPVNLNPANPFAVISYSGNLLLLFLSFLVTYNLILMIFNLIPLPPLDGSKVLFAILPPKYQHWQFYLEKNGPMILLILIIMDNFFGIGILSGFFNLIIGFFGQVYGF